MAVGGNTGYADITDLPPLVRNTGGRIGETGTGCGVGLAWMLDATDESTSIVSVELDPGRAAASAALGASAHDHARRCWLGHPALQATELRLSPTLATLVGVRVR